MFKSCQKHIALLSKVRTNKLKDVGDPHWIRSATAVATVMISESEDFLDSETTPTLACGCCRQIKGLSMFPFSGGKKRGEEEGCYQEGS